VKVKKMEKLESQMIPDSLDYNDIVGLKTEAREKLVLVKPQTIGQATRISGVDPSDISILLVYLEAERRAGNVPRGTN